MQLTKDEPVLVAHGVTAVLAWVSTYLVAHGVITGTQASAITQAVLPFVVALAIAGLGVVVRHYVTPAAKALGVSEADLGRVAAMIEGAGFLHAQKPNTSLPPALPPETTPAAPTDPAPPAA